MFHPSEVYIYIFVDTTSIRAVKMGYNPRVNPAHHGFGSDRVEKKLQISVRVKNELDSLKTRFIRIEPVMSRIGGSPTHQ